jgi:hypothetical protein
MWTVAPDTTAPDESVTWPTTPEDEFDWANAKMQLKQTAITTVRVALNNGNRILVSPWTEISRFEAEEPALIGS